MSGQVRQVESLAGAALDYAAGEAVGVEVSVHWSRLLGGWRVRVAKPFTIKHPGCDPFHDKSYRTWAPSSDGATGAELLHTHAVSLEPVDPFREGGGSWFAVCVNALGERCRYHGETPLIAGMRAIVGALRGGQVEIPTELLEHSA